MSNLGNILQSLPNSLALDAVWSTFCGHVCNVFEHCTLIFFSNQTHLYYSKIILPTSRCEVHASLALERTRTGPRESSLRSWKRKIGKFSTRVSFELLLCEWQLIWLCTWYKNFMKLLWFKVFCHLLGFN